MFSHLTKEREISELEQFYWEFGCINVYFHFVFFQKRKMQKDSTL